MDSAPAISATDTDITHTQIRDQRYVLALQGIWVFAFLISAAIIAVNVPYYYNTVRDLPLVTASFFLRGLAQSAPVWYSGLDQFGLSPELPALYFTALMLISNLAFFAVAAVIFYYRSNNWMAMWLSLACILFAPVNTTSYWVLETLPGGVWLIIAFVPVAISVVISLLYVLPDGRFVPAAGKWMFGACALLEMVRFHQQIFRTALFVSLPYFLWLLPMLVFFCVGVGAQVYRYRRASPVYRHQLKWFVFGVALLLLAWIGFALGTTFAPRLAATGSAAAFVIFELITGSLPPIGGIVLGLCIAVAVTRYRLYDINIVINRSLVYGIVLLLMIAVFLGGGFLLQSLLHQSSLAFTVSVAGAALLFNPSYRRVQHFVDRRFYGLRFDLNELSARQKPPEIKNQGLYTGRTFGPYEVQDVIGKGGMGEVYKGVGEGKVVALKVLSGIHAAEHEFRVRFQREAQTLAAFDHPNIVKVYHSNETEGIFYMALEFVEGQELGVMIKQRGTIPFEETRPFIRDFAAALDYAHSKGLVHRDIKSSNIMLRRKADSGEMEAVLMDFGIAKIQESHTSVTGTGAIGTIQYMAPEQITEAKEVDHRADIYALGVVMYEMLTGSYPFKGNPGQILFAHLHQPPPDPRSLYPDIPAHVAAAIMRAMAKDREDRFQSVGDFAEALLASPSTP